MPSFNIRPLSRLEQTANAAMYPLMRMLMEVNGTPDEHPQLTHFWDNKKIRNEADEVSSIGSVKVPGDSDAWPLPGFARHLPIIGWQRYVVLQPKSISVPWHLGWKTASVVGYSRIEIHGPARALIGPKETEFFGLDEFGRQIPIRIAGFGKLGRDPENFQIPLL